MATLERTAEAKRLAATLAGGTAVLLWALLALFTTWASGIPPFQLVSLCFTVAALIGFGVIARKGRAGWQSLRQPAGAWALGSFGLFGYHFFYFMALGNAPAVEASLIAYLWPLLIVVFSALLPGERLRWFHLAGALLGLAGAGLLVTKGQGLAFDTRYGLGYLAAVACALTWSIYSVANRRFGSVPTDTVAGFCAAAALLGFISHALFETWVMPTATQWGAILLLGLGPVGAAFFVWDYGTKHGHIQALGALAYGAPLLSTLLLIAFGQAEATWSVALACGLIVGGALLASLELLRWR
ncbi:DMT family transporter [Algihabitans albus]|uniref:aromatic amino acid exporter YddG n=1 Tax=Algihabitans albus TaxID=2164067 RepID=UPI0035CF6B5C